LRTRAAEIELAGAAGGASNLARYENGEHFAVVAIVSSNRDDQRSA